MAENYEIVKGFSTENGEGRYDFDYLHNKPGRASIETDGLAPQLSGDQATFWRGDGEWAEIPVYAEATQQAAGLMSAADKIKVNGMDKAISDAVGAIKVPVQSVNGKTGAVVLDSDAVGAASKEYVDKHINTVRDIISNFHSNIENEVKGEVIQVNDSAKAPISGLRVFGKTKQKMTTGRNLYNVKKIYLGSFTGKVDENDIITLQVDNSGGTSASWTSFYTPVSDKIVPSKQYAFIIEVFEKENLIIYPGHSNTNTNPGQIVVDSSITKDGPGIYVLIGTARENFDNCLVMCRGNGYVPAGEIGYAKFRVTLVEDVSIATDNFTYEPYTGGIPSPNPDYPQVLESVGDSGSVTVTACGKNLLKNTATTRTLNGVTFTVNEDGFVNIFGTATANASIKIGDITYEPGKTYIVSGNSGATSTAFALWSGGVGSIYDTDKTFTATEETKTELSLTVFKGANVNTTIYPMIRPASVTDDTYEPYTATTVTVTTPNGLPGIPVSQNGNYTDPVTKQQWLCDEVDFEKGVYVQRVTRLIFTGTETFNAGSVANTYTYAIGEYAGNIIATLDGQCDASTWEKDQRLECSHFTVLDAYVASANRDDGTVSIYPGNGLIYLAFKTYGKTMTEYATEQHASGNPVTVLFPRAKENLIPLTSDELTQYAAMHTNYPNTMVHNDVGAYMSVCYVQDTKIYVDKKFAELAEIILNKS